MICKNCNTNLHKDQLFCAQCGAQVIIDRITTKKFINEFIERYFSLDNKFLLTFKTLFTKPEDVVLGYFNGIRKKYINPFSFLLIAITLTGLQFFLMKKGLLGGFDLPMVNKQKNGFDPKEIMDSIGDYQGIITILFFPFFALMTKILFNKIKAYNFAEHMVLNIYLYNQINILTTVLTIVLGLVNFNMTLLYSVLMFSYFIYYIYALKRIYNLGLGKVLLKTLLFILLLLGAFLLLLVLFAIIGFAYKVLTS